MVLTCLCFAGPYCVVFGLETYFFDAHLDPGLLRTDRGLSKNDPGLSRIDPGPLSCDPDPDGVESGGWGI